MKNLDWRGILIGAAIGFGALMAWHWWQNRQSGSAGPGGQPLGANLNSVLTGLSATGGGVNYYGGSETVVVDATKTPTQTHTPIDSGPGPGPTPPSGGGNETVAVPLTNATMSPLRRQTATASAGDASE